MHHFIVTRFSILDNDFKGFNLTRSTDDFEKYKTKLFDPERLDFKFNVFLNFTAKSIRTQTINPSQYTWLIYTSNELPEPYKSKLEDFAINAKDSKQNIKILYTDTIKNFFDDIDRQINYSGNYTTIRLDDDDVLNPNLLHELSAYDDVKYDKTIISFPLGIKFSVDNNTQKQQPIYGLPLNYKKVAAGLSAINMNIYKCGNHTKVDKVYKVIYNNLPNAYEICCSEFCDTSRKL